MRKGIVMEHHRGYTIILTEFGTLHKAKPINNVEVGMETSFEILPESRGVTSYFQGLKQRSQLRLVAMVVAVLIAVFPLYSWYDSNQAYAYVNVDINPSIEIEINENRKVLDLIPHNKDASDLLQDIPEWKHQSAEEVILTIIELSEEEGLLDEKNSVLVGVSYLHGTEKRNITEKIENHIRENASALTIATFVIPEELRKKAKEKSQSANEYMAERLSDNSQSGTDSSTKPVKLDGDDKEIIQSFYNKQDKVKGKGNNLKKDKPIQKDKDQQISPPGKEKDKENNPSSKETNQHPGKGKGLDKKPDIKENTPGKGNGPPEKLTTGQKGKSHSPSGADKKNKDASPAGKVKKEKTPPGQEKNKQKNGKGPN